MYHISFFQPSIKWQLGCFQFWPPGIMLHIQSISKPNMFFFLNICSNHLFLFQHFSRWSMQEGLVWITLEGDGSLERRGEIVRCREDRHCKCGVEGTGQGHTWSDCSLHSIREHAFLQGGHLERRSLGYPAFSGREQSLIQQCRERLEYRAKGRWLFLIDGHKYPLFDYFDRNQPN